MIKLEIYGVLAAICLFLGGCGVQDNVYGQSTEQDTEQSAGPEKEKTRREFDTYELASYAEGNLVLQFSFEELGDLVKSQYVCPSEDGSR